MSNYHRIRCDTCDEQCPSETLNWGGKGLRMALERLEALLPLTTGRSGSSACPRA